MPQKGSPRPSILLWGGRAKARIAAAMVEEANLGKVEVIFDASLQEAMFPSSARFVNDVAELAAEIERISHFIVCIGGQHGFARVETARHLERLGLSPISLQHETSYVDTTATVGAGCQIMPSANVHKFGRVGDYVVVNTNATIDHECVIGDGVHIMGGAAIAGQVSIGNFATIGTNATIAPHLTIGEAAFVGAGSVVLRDVDSGMVAAGNPARYLRSNDLVFDRDVLHQLNLAVRSP